jgi:hypothetical protein
MAALKQMSNRRPLGVAAFALAVALCPFIAAWADGVQEAEEKSAKEAATSASGDDKSAEKSEIKLSPLATTGPKPEPITPPEPQKIVATMDRGVAFLLADQREDGSWGSAQKTKGLNIYAPAPGSHEAFRAAVTSLAVMALIESEPLLPAERKAAVDKAIDRGADWLVAHLTRIRRATPDALYNVWGHAYAIQALVRLHGRAEGDDEKQAKFRELAASQADMLRRYSFVGGGWSYYDLLIGSQIPSDAAFSFCTATVLIALHEAKSLKIEFPQKLIDKAIASIHRQRKPDFSYAYGEYLRMFPMMDINRPGGSLGRSQACNLALRLYGDERVTDEVIETWLDRLYARNGWLSVGRKRPIPHESYFGVAGYFYFYGHWHAALCIDQLPAEKRRHFQEHLAHILIPLQEKDGSWWDYPFYNYHQQYGTAMAIMSLVRCHPDWEPRRN